MNLLAIDCSASLCAACVYDAQTDKELGRAVLDLGKGHAEKLMAAVGDALKEAKVGFPDLGAVAVSVGPGSFTGVRVGVSAARGFALALKIPAIGVTTLEALAAEARDAGCRHLVFASTCSNYGRMADPEVAIDETGVLAPVSLYAEQKVAVERMLLSGDWSPLAPTCLRLATVYGVAPRMRFDLTVNEFTRDLWADRDLEVFGERFWRPYVHVRDAARAVRTVLDADPERTRGEVFNVGHSDENYRKLDLVEIITSQVERGRVSYVHRDEDPRDYKVAFGKVRDVLGFEPGMRVPDGVREVALALDEGAFADPWAAAHRNIP
jgi:tRNA threonylcarbamoyl adenosine modification protein YeaZ